MIEAALSMAKVQFAHNHWANEVLLEALKALSPEQYASTPCSGNGTIGATVAHLIVVQQSWISWLNGSLELPAAFAVVKTASELKTVADVEDRWLIVDEDTSDYLESLTDEDFVTERSFTLPSGASSLPLWEMLLQVTSHGVHTRGQIVSAMRTLGGKPPEVSFLSFCMQRKQESAVTVGPEIEDEVEK